MSESQEFNPYLVTERSTEIVEEKIVIDPSELRDSDSEQEQRQELSIGKILFSPEGRVSRWTFFKYSTLTILAWWILATLMVAISQNFGIFMLVSTGLVVGYSHIVLLVKRWHDMNEAGTSAIMNFIPIIGIYAMIKVYLSKGTSGRNDYGLEEKGGWLVPDEFEDAKLDFYAKL